MFVLAGDLFLVVFVDNEIFLQELWLLVRLLGGRVGLVGRSCISKLLQEFWLEGRLLLLGGGFGGLSSSGVSFVTLS